MYASLYLLTKLIQEWDKLVKKRQTDPGVIQNVPQTPGAEEFGKVSGVYLREWREALIYCYNIKLY